MILAGLNDDSSITPQSLIANVDEYYNGVTSKYVSSSGSVYSHSPSGSHGIYDTNFLQKYYNCKSTYIGSTDDTKAFAALEAGKCIVGHETGHMIAMVPVSSDKARQGYKFYVLDSCKAHNTTKIINGEKYYHTAPFKSRAEFLDKFPTLYNGETKNECTYRFIIEKLP